MVDLVQKEWPTGETVVSMNRGTLTRSILLLLNVALLLTIWLLWRNAPESDSALAAAGVTAAPLQLPPSPLRNLTLEQYQELVSRPLFWSERRAQEIESPAEVASGKQPMAFVLIGVVMSPQSKHALLSKSGAGEVVKVQPGDIVEGWQVDSMTADSVSLSRGGEHQKIFLDEARSKSP